MDSFDWNRLAVSGLISVCVFSVSWGLGSFVIQNNIPLKAIFSNDNDQNETIDLKTANANKGKELAAQQCSLCHTFVQNGVNKIGPNLYNIFGQNIASITNFSYSEDLKSHHKESWDIQKLNSWLKSPATFASGTNMAYPGIASKQDRIDIIEYLKTISPASEAHKDTTPSNVSK